MTRLERAKLLRSVQRVRVQQSSGEELARELNILLRTVGYASHAEWLLAVKQCALRVGKENEDVLLGRRR